MNDKLRLDYFLSVGGKLTKGDGCYNVENEEPNVFKEVVQKGDVFAGQLRFSGEGYGIYGKGDLKHLVITSFTDRENEGVQPVPDDFPVVANPPLGACSRLASEICWSDIFSRVIVTWKPDYKALLKMQAEHDKHNEPIVKACDEANKKESEMVYTQEMKDNGELPMVGMRCAVDFLGGNIHADSTILFINENGFVFRDNDDGRESFNGTVNDGVVKFYPRKTPEQLELEEAQEKQVDDLIMEYLGIRVSAEEWELRDLFNDMQKNGHLAEIILPLKK